MIYTHMCAYIRACRQYSNFYIIIIIIIIITHVDRKTSDMYFCNNGSDNIDKHMLL